MARKMHYWVLPVHGFEVDGESFFDVVREDVGDGWCVVDSDGITLLPAPSKVFATADCAMRFAFFKAGECGLVHPWAPST